MPSANFIPISVLDEWQRKALAYDIAIRERDEARAEVERLRTEAAALYSDRIERLHRHLQVSTAMLNAAIRILRTAPELWNGKAEECGPYWAEQVKKNMAMIAGASSENP